MNIHPFNNLNLVSMQLFEYRNHPMACRTSIPTFNSFRKKETFSKVAKIVETSLVSKISSKSPPFLLRTLVLSKEHRSRKIHIQHKTTTKMNATTTQIRPVAPDLNTSSSQDKGGVPSGFVLKLYQMVNGAPDEIVSVSPMSFFLDVL